MAVPAASAAEAVAEDAAADDEVDEAAATPLVAMAATDTSAVGAA